MKSTLHMIASFACALTLSACGGGDSGPAIDPDAQPAAYSQTDTVLGTGATAATGLTATVKYTGWLYSAKAADHKGIQFDSNTIDFQIGSSGIIQGWNTGIPGMKVGGKRTLILTSAEGYGATGKLPAIPGGAGLVFDVELLGVK
jgi:FKBP-type peptidyl-prolyl cis-trans isomerase FkpA